jgi:hypothetical protein
MDLGGFKYEGKRGAGYLARSAPESREANPKQINTRGKATFVFMRTSSFFAEARDRRFVPRRVKTEGAIRNTASNARQNNSIEESFHPSISMASISSIYGNHSGS